MTGLKLHKPNIFKDHQQLSFHKTFGSTVNLIDIDLDKNLSNFNQNTPNPLTGEPALPNGCTAFARADTATNEDQIIYDPNFTYTLACQEENVPVGSPLYLETAYKVSRYGGLKAVSEASGKELNHRRGPYFWIAPKVGQDWFDAMWSALVMGVRPLSVGSNWYPEMTQMTIIDEVNIRPTSDGHAWEVCGVSTQNGIPRMKVKWWGGAPKWFGRSAINSLLSQSGSVCLTDVDGKATVADLRSTGFISLLMQELINFITRLSHQQ